MKTFAMAAGASLLLFGVAQSGDESALKKELSALEGKWNWVKFESNEKRKESYKGASMTFLKDGKTVEFAKGNVTKKGVFEVNPATKIKTLTIFAGGDDGVIFGIYKIENDVLTICATERASDGRPTAFALEENKKFVLMTLERAK